MRRFLKISTVLPLLASNAFAETRNKKGVYLWGDNSNNLISKNDIISIREPMKVEFLDNKVVKDLAICPKFALAVLKNGQVCQWTSPDNHQALSKLPRVKKVHITPKTSHAVALANDGSIYTWEFTKPEEIKMLKIELNWFEHVADVQCGADHLVALTNKGRVFSGFISKKETAEHHGQLGIASFPHFDSIPEPLILHPVKLVKGGVKQIACGDYHTLMLNEQNELFGCGSNKFCQLMLPFTYKNTKISAPAKIASDCTAVAAGSSITMFEQGKKWLVCGNGEYGQFGTGSFSQCQISPLTISTFEQIQEFDESVNQVVSVAPSSLSIGETHVYAQMSNVAKDVFLWGSNEKGQLGNNKLSKIIKPTPITSISENFQKIGPAIFVAGDKISGCFSI